MGLIMHTPDGSLAGYDRICQVPVPEATTTYSPVANRKLVEFIRERVSTILGMDIIHEQYGLSRKDQQMFGVICLDSGNTENGLSIGFRNSYDKSLSIGVASGASVFVCDNLAFSGTSGEVIRKHTVNVWRDITVKVDQALRASEQHYITLNKQMSAMKQIPMGLDDGFALIGRALGHDVLRPRQATVALQDWKTPRYEDFSERNLYSLYNCFTEGLKRGPAGDTLDRHATAHDFFMAQFDGGHAIG